MDGCVEDEIRLLEERVSTEAALVEALDKLEASLRKEAKRRCGCLPKRLRPAEVEIERIWYRGQPDGNYPLLPSLHRITHGVTQELRIFQDFRRLDIQSQHDRDEDWTVLYKMQHSGVPTRLLDWTELRLMALFFAFGEELPSSPAIYLLSPCALSPKGPIALPETKYVPFLKSLRTLSRGGALYRPLPLMPDLKNPRMAAQRGCFTLQGRCCDPLEIQIPESLARIWIDPALAGRLRKTLGWDQETLDIFPDDAGRALHIKRKYELHPTRSLARYLRDRWQRDLVSLERARETGQAPEEPLFAGLRGCAMGSAYIPVKHQKDSPTLTEWLSESSRLTRSVFVLGGAGSGKTNYILHAVETAYKHAKANAIRPPLVLWCPLGKLKTREEVLEAVATALNEAAAGQTDERPNAVTADLVRALCQQEPVWLVLDGLDELARTRGNEEVNRILRNVERELEQDKRKNISVVLGCRDHPYRSVGGGWAKRVQAGDPIVLEELDEEQVSVALGVERSSAACKVVMKVPLFIAAVKRLGLQGKLSGPTTTDALFRDVILRKVVGKRGARGLRELGRVAALMIDNRRDYLSGKDIQAHPKEGETILRYSRAGKRQWPLFVRESGEEWRFVHQSIREYLLGWNIFDGLRSTGERAWLINESSSLDYESGEVYCFVADLLQSNGPASFETLAATCLRQLSNQPDVWNRMMRNLFEAVGNVGEECSWETRLATLRAALDVLESPAATGKPRGAHSRVRFPVSTHKRPYANFVTRYNAARCLERLHGSGPPCYCKYWLRRESPAGRYYYQVHTYAIRGFQKKERRISATPWLPFDKDRRVGIVGTDAGLADRTWKVLSGALGMLLSGHELDHDAGFLAVNLSLALARWAPYDTGRTSEGARRLRDLLGQARRLPDYSARPKGATMTKSRRVSASEAVVFNLELARWYRSHPRCARLVKGEDGKGCPGRTRDVDVVAWSDTANLARVREANRKGSGPRASARSQAPENPRVPVSAKDRAVVRVRGASGELGSPPEVGPQRKRRRSGHATRH